MMTPLAQPTRVTASQSGTVGSRAEAEAVAGEFEQILIQQMVTGLRKTTSLDGEDGGLFGKGAGTDTYNDWFDAHLSQHLMSSGGIGVRETLLRDWERLGQVAPNPRDTDSSETSPVKPRPSEPTASPAFQHRLDEVRVPLPPRHLPSSLGQPSPATGGGLHAFA